LDKGIDDLDDEVVTVKNAIENMSFDADSISYDNTSSGLQATDVQDAVDEINDNLTDGIGGTSDKFRFGTDGNGNYGYIKKVAGADTFFPFKPALTDKNASKQRTWGKYYISSKGLLFDIDDYEIKYKKIAVYNMSNVSDTLKFYGQNLTLLGSQSISNNVWTQYYNIPSGTYYIYIDTTGSSGWYYSLLTH
jgi:hypothetical protein